ncbi:MULTISPECIES: hypothetical protein [Candidatus Nitrosocaldus]|jgi:cell division protein FtsZ|uniref:Putative Tubulin/FtsZ family GTPase n=1 Tax=Candidatus Nitrosocaldus cavascurensis TaxID=2058097 RepID=A0A2K5ARR2_9ARCH|nr:MULTISPECIES: hypothetical protein [Candidatus Nitrosocaldus]SPC34338.1 putative Tubulin/FtsZ family GTPase [Candidatus Nitrosocaldus cavascurensis]
MELPLPAMIIGIGGAGTKIAMMMRDVSALDTLLISSSANDLAITSMSMDKRRKVSKYDDGGGAASLSDGAKEPRMERMLIETGMLNPSPYTIRGSLLAYKNRIRERLMGYNTFIMVANLAGRNGVAVAPLLADMIKADHDDDDATASSSNDNNSKKKKKKARLISFVIMPFSFEHDKLFKAGIALKKLSERSDCTIVIDNDSFLENNQDLSIDECYRIANGMLLEVFNIIMMNSEVDGLNILSAGIDSRVDVAVKNAVSMLYSNTKPDKVRSALLYIFDGSTEGISIGLIDALAKSISSILVGRHGEYAVVRVSTKGRSRMMHVDGENDDDYEGIDNDNNEHSSIGSSSISNSNSSSNASGTKVGADDSKESDEGVHSTILLSKVTGLSKLDSYDPLSILPRECLLDWEYDESEMRLNIDSLVALPNLE